MVSLTKGDFFADPVFFNVLCLRSVLKHVILLISLALSCNIITYVNVLHMLPYETLKFS